MSRHERAEHDNARDRLSSVMPSDPAVRVILLGVLIAAPFMILAVANGAGLSVLWDNLHWSLASVAAFAATIVGARGQGLTPRARTIRRLAVVAFGLWMVANVTWGLLAVLHVNSIPSIADAFVVAVFVPAVLMLGTAVHGRLTAAEEVAVYFDSALLVILIGTILILVHGDAALALPTASGAIALAFPTAFIGLGAAGLVANSAIRLPLAPHGGFALIAGSAIIGLAYLGFIVPTVTGTVAGGVPGVLFTVGTLVAALGASTWRDESDDRPRYVTATRFVTRVIGPTAAAVSLLAHQLTLAPPVDAIVRIGAFVTGILVVIRQALLLRERTHTLAEMRTLHDENDRLVDELRAELIERGRVQDHLINTSRLAAVGELAAGVAHEVNNPLTAVLGFSEILLEDLPPEDPNRADVQTIRDAALRARTIVRALRDFARPREPQLAPTDLPELVTKMVDLVRFPLTRSGVIIRESHGELPLIELDPQAIQQVILNVLTNAMQAMPEGGALGVETSIRGSQAIVRITDSGVGMDESAVAQAFVPFFSARDAADSTGLGLSVSLGLVESHNGTISLESSEGVGTTVEISLPLLAGHDEPAEPAEGAETVSSLQVPA
jgi:signal transduction histidine kinase